MLLPIIDKSRMVAIERAPTEAKMHQGGYGVVKPMLLDGRQKVVVKVAMLNGRDAMDRERDAYETFGRHPHILRCFGRTECGGVVLEMHEATLWDVMTMSDEDKREWIPDSRVALKILKDIASGVRHMHSFGMVHCDLRPSNIFVSRSRPDCSKDSFPRVVVGDLGLVEDVGSKFSARYTKDRSGLSHLSPDKASSYVLDVFGLGVMLAEMFLGPMCYSSHFRKHCVQPRFVRLTADELLKDGAAHDPEGVAREIWNIHDVATSTFPDDRMSLNWVSRRLRKALKKL